MPTPPSQASRVPCRDHATAPAVTRCASCSRPLCDECFRFRLGDRAACARCAYEAGTRRPRRVSLAVAFLSFAWGGGFWLARRNDLWQHDAGYLVVGAVLAAVVAALIAATAGGASQPVVEHRQRTDDEVVEWDERAGNPYRAGARRVLLAASPRLSGRATALAVGASLTAAAVLLPASLKLPRWIETELVLALWWLIVAGTLVVLLYRGFRLRDDHVYFAPWDRPARSSDAGTTAAAPDATASKRSGVSKVLDGCSSVDGCSGLDGEGCLGAVVVGLALVAAFGAAWVFVEFAMPLVFFLMYWLLMRAIGRVANDGHACAGQGARALGWGALWATVYVAPIAALTWILHALHR